MDGAAVRDYLLADHKIRAAYEVLANAKTDTSRVLHTGPLASGKSKVTFTTEHGGDIPPILLIDEAEIHLHYDAQADLIQMLGAMVRAHGVQRTGWVVGEHSVGIE